MVLSKLLSAVPKRPGGNATAIRHRGFTIIEVVVVLVLLGILAAVAASRITGTQEAERNAEIANLKNHLRYAQMRAMNSGGPDDPVVWGINGSGTQYWLFTIDTSNNQIVHRLPGQNENQVTLERITVSNLPVGFNYFGQPINIGTMNPVNSAITVLGGEITITPDTGFIE